MELIEAPDVSERAFRTYWRKIAPIDRLLRDHLISPREHRVAAALRQLYEHTHQGELRSAPLDVVRLDVHCRRRDHGELRQQQRRALEHLRHLIAALGTETFDILVLVTVNEMCWARIGRGLGAALQPPDDAVSRRYGCSVGYGFPFTPSNTKQRTLKRQEERKVDPVGQIWPARRTKMAATSR
jgi:hypothetical protein